jgi:hypothetical protein
MHLVKVYPVAKGFIHKEDPNATRYPGLPVHRKHPKEELEKHILFVRKRKSEEINKIP